VCRYNPAPLVPGGPLHAHNYPAPVPPSSPLSTEGATGTAAADADGGTGAAAGAAEAEAEAAVCASVSLRALAPLVDALVVSGRAPQHLPQVGR